MATKKKKVRRKPAKRMADPVLRIRDIKRHYSCPGVMDHAKAVLGAEPVLNESTLDKAVENNIRVPWLTKIMSPATNYEIALKLMRKSIQALLGFTTNPSLTATIEGVARILRRKNIEADDFMQIKLDMHVAFVGSDASSTMGKAYDAFRFALQYLELAGTRTDQEAAAAENAVTKLAEVEAALLVQKIKRPFFKLFMDGVVEEKRERILRRKS